jgi:phosphoribosylformimino-5-aminoimidazole carboxamide ribotide isomerase
VIVYPAIDLRGGRCVRLFQGDFERETVYGDDPVVVARRWQAAGARWLHVVDLDGAREGRPVQLEIVAAICRAVDIPVQVGGGLRDAAAVGAVLAAGAARVVVGTVAVQNPRLCKKLCRAHRDRVAIGLDAREGKLAVAGWTEGTEMTAVDAAARAAKQGAAAIIYTNIGRDGTEDGPDVEGTRTLAGATSVPVIASGGVGSLEHLRAVAALAEAGVAGVIVGRALYSGAVRLAEAQAAAGDV